MDETGSIENDAPFENVENIESETESGDSESIASEKESLQIKSYCVDHMLEADEKTRDDTKQRIEYTERKFSKIINAMDEKENKEKF